MLLKDSWEEFGKNLTKAVEGTSGIFTFPIKAEIFEELISRHALDPMGIPNAWEPGSHKQGADIDIPQELYSFSVKSAKISGVNKKKMSISSFRTTAYPTLKEKLDFIDGDGKNFSHYLVLAREEDEKGRTRKYTVLVIPADLFIAKDLVWVEINSGWKSMEKYDEERGYAMVIQRKMSDQLWIYCDYVKLLNNPRVMALGTTSIPENEIGTTHEIVERAA